MPNLWIALTSENHRRFFQAFAITWFAGLVLVAGLNLAVDPYAQYGTGLKAPIVRTSRREKLELLREAELSQPPVEGLVLGSSRVMKFEPQCLEAHTGYRFFNAGVYYGRTEDYLALLRASRRALGHWPRMVVVGVDIDAFTPQIGPDAELLHDGELRRDVAHLLSIDDQLRPLKELLSWQQTMNSIRSLRSGGAALAEHALEETFSAGGTIQYHRRETEMANGVYDFAGALDFTRREYLRMYREYDNLSPQRVQAWRELVDLCTRESIELQVFLTTWQPQLLSGLEAKTTYEARKQEVLSLLRETQQQTTDLQESRVWDFTELSTFGGDSAQFVDGIHPLEPNTRRMVDVMFSSPRMANNEMNELKATHVVQ